MQILRSFFIFVLISVCLMLLVYFVHFNLFFIPLFSHQQSDWASFGSFIGGTTGTLVAFLAYCGVRQQLEEQRTSFQKQLGELAFRQHIESIKASLEKINILSIKSVKPLEEHVKINLDTCLSSQLKTSTLKADPLIILQDVIHASRLIQSADFIYKKYTDLIERSTENLSEDTSLNEHFWSAIATWREFEKRAKFINHLAIKTKDELLENNQEIYTNELKEIKLYLIYYEIWNEDWKKMKFGF
ncbi:hypothetical protein [Pseudocolwellia agarivorans]|uniref:hypothetical protein n=1 Tax=Pseudocolwellia agarivorans TaxID=1911682 RepID=UPI003F8805A9